jgi:hypothetical protein
MDSSLRRSEAERSLSRAKSQLEKAIYQRKLELVDNPDAIRLYLQEINSAASRRSDGKKPYIVKIRIAQQAGEELSSLTIRILRSRGKDIDYTVPLRLLPKVFPSIQSHGIEPSDFVDHLTNALKKKSGLAVPFDNLQKFHFVAGPLESSATLCRDHFLAKFAVAQLEQEGHPSIATLRDCEQKKLKADRIYETAAERWTAHWRAHSIDRSIHDDWSQALSLAKASLLANGRQGILEVRKVSTGYTLTFNKEPVFRLGKDGSSDWLSARKKREPFVIVTQRSTPNLHHALRLSELKPGDFLTSSGKLIVGEPRAVIEEVFQAASSDIRIFPSDDISRRVERIKEKTEAARKQQYYTRHWANAFIESFNPDRIEARAFSTDGQWKVYVFEQIDRIVAEADHWGNATYVGTLLALSFFLAQSRAQIRSAPPAGFVKRIVYQGAEEELNTRWKEEIAAVLHGR